MGNRNGNKTEGIEHPESTNRTQIDDEEWEAVYLTVSGLYKDKDQVLLCSSHVG